jgi:urease accessory protein
MRGDRPTFLVSLRDDPLATPIAAWVRSLVAARVAA